MKNDFGSKTKAINKLYSLCLFTSRCRNIDFSGVERFEIQIHPKHHCNTITQI